MHEKRSRHCSVRTSYIERCEQKLGIHWKGRWPCRGTKRIQGLFLRKIALSECDDHVLVYVTVSMTEVQESMVRQMAKWPPQSMTVFCDLFCLLSASWLWNGAHQKSVKQVIELSLPRSRNTANLFL